MVWTPPRPFQGGDTFDAADWNTLVRDNLQETARALTVGDASTSGYFTSDAENSIVYHQSRGDHVYVTENTTSTSFVDLTTIGPTVSVDVSVGMIVFWVTYIIPSTEGEQGVVTFDIQPDGLMSADNWGIAHRAGFSRHASMVGGAVVLRPIPGGTKDVTMKYKSTLGDQVDFAHRHLAVIPF